MRFAKLPRWITQVLGPAFAATASMASPASDADRAEVTAAGAEWAAKFGGEDLDAIASLYETEAVLLGTLSPTIAAGKQAVRGYFEMAFEALPGHKVTFEEQHIRLYGELAINDGYYVFSYVKDGQARSLRARYSFVYRRRGGTWLIIDHHSSALPALPP